MDDATLELQASTLLNTGRIVTLGGYQNRALSQGGARQTSASGADQGFGVSLAGRGGHCELYGPRGTL